VAVLGGNIGPVAVTILGASGELCSSATNSITVAKGAGAPGGTLNGTLTQSAVSGVATFNDLNITVTTGSYTLAATSSGLTGATSNAFTIATGQAGSGLLKRPQ